MVDKDTAVTVILGSISSQYKISKARLRDTKLARVVEEEVERILYKNGGKEFKVADFPFSKILDEEENVRPELLKPA